MNDLPHGWAWARLDEIAEVRLGRQRSPKNHTGSHMRPYLRAANVDWSGLKLDDVKHMNFTDAELEVYHLEKDDILLTEASGSADEVGKSAIWRGAITDCCFQNTLIRVRPYGVDPDYLQRFLTLEALQKAFVAGARGVGINHLGSSRLASWLVPVPPLPEQWRLVDRLESSLGQLEASQRPLQSVIVRLGHLERQCPNYAVRAAVDGEGAEPPRATDSVDIELPNVPASWRWRRLGDIAEVVGGLAKDSKKQSDPRLHQVPYLRVANVQAGYLDLTELSRVRVTDAQFVKLALQRGDVLLNEGGDRDKLGRGWVWEEQVENCLHQNHVFRARLYDPRLNPRLVAWHANSYGRKWFERNGKQSINLASVSLSTIKNFPVPIPPTDERDQLVADVLAVLEHLRRLRAVVELATTRAATLRRELLAAAFRGELVDQDPSDEPAGVLLARIRADRETAVPAKRPQTRKVSAQ